jgi:hypothetical protein
LGPCFGCFLYPKNTVYKTFKKVGLVKSGKIASIFLFLGITEI